MVFNETYEQIIEVTIDIISEYELLMLFPDSGLPTLSNTLLKWMEKFSKIGSLESIVQLYTLIDLLISLNKPFDSQKYLNYAMQQILSLPLDSTEMSKDKFGACICFMISRCSIYIPAVFESSLSQLSVPDLLNAWIGRADLAMSDYSRKINIAAIITVLSRMPPSIDIFNKLINSIAPLIELYAKQPSMRMASPGKLQNDQVVNNDTGVSLRLSKLRESEMQKIDIVSLFMSAYKVNNYIENGSILGHD